jgi:hypothetical protein
MVVIVAVVIGKPMDEGVHSSNGEASSVEIRVGGGRWCWCVALKKNSKTRERGGGCEKREARLVVMALVLALVLVLVLVLTLALAVVLVVLAALAPEKIPAANVSYEIGATRVHASAATRTAPKTASVRGECAKNTS